tara:strand:- start:540 stop:749 length:210 start_codon:yes stop_codon:yes gene_type:complete
MSVIYDKSLKSTADSSWGIVQIKSKGLHILLHENETDMQEIQSSICSNSKDSVNVETLIEQLEDLSSIN